MSTYNRNINKVYCLNVLRNKPHVREDIENIILAISV